MTRSSIAAPAYGLSWATIILLKCSKRVLTYAVVGSVGAASLMVGLRWKIIRRALTSVGITVYLGVSISIALADEESRGHVPMIVFTCATSVPT